MSRTTQQTQEIITILNRLASTSEGAKRAVNALQQAMGRLSISARSDVGNLAGGIKDFTTIIKRLGATDTEIKRVASAFFEMGIASSKSMSQLRSLLSFKDIDKTKLPALISATRKELEKIYAPFGGGKTFRGLERQLGKNILPPDVEKKVRSVTDAVEKLRQKYNLLVNEVASKRDIGSQTYLGTGRGIAFPEPQGGLPKGMRSLAEANQGFISNLGLSKQASEALTKRFSDLGLMGLKVTGNVLDLNSGLRHLTVNGFDPLTNTVQKATITLDRGGSVLASSQNKFRTFFSGIARDIVEVAKWSIAITAIYAPVRKFNELIEESKKIQSDLIDVQISLGQSTVDLQNIFEASLDIANQTSSAVEGVIEGYTAAVAASGSVIDSSARMATTQILVRDSMILSKLAGLEQKESLDTLVGALRQADLSLTDGMTLLDSWVAVSRNANVSINQLATTFAIVGSGAEEVGLSFSELNALAATMAESTKLSADEVGNAIRGIIASLQSDTATEEFAKYGIATKTLSGDLRNMMEILRELKTLQQGGILDEKAMGAITQAGGGGARRGAQLSALIKNLDRVMEIITVSENASGDATKALDLKMSTLESATQRLNNAFSGLAQTLGMEGGIIKGLTMATEVATGMIKVIRDLVGIMKVAAPVLGAAGLLKLFSTSGTATRLMGAQLPNSLARLFIQPTEYFAGKVGTGTGVPDITGYGKLGNAPLTNAILSMLQKGNAGLTTDVKGAMVVNSFGGVLQRFTEFFSKKFAGNLSMGSFAVPAMMMASSFGREDTTERVTTQAVGTSLGAVLGKSTIWTAVGSIIATAFYDKFLTFSENIAQEWMISLEGLQPSKPPGDETDQQSLERLSDEVIDSLSLWEKFIVNLLRTGINAGAAVGGKEFDTSGIGTASQSEALLGVRLVWSGMLDEETRNKLDELLATYLVTTAENNLTLTSSEVIQQSNIRRVSEFAATAASDLMEKALEGISTGASGAVQDYLRFRQAGTQFATTAGNLITAQQQAGIEQFTPTRAVNLVTGITAEEQQILSQLLTDIVTGTTSVEELQAAMEASGEATDAQKEALEKLVEQIQLAKLALPGVVNALERAAALRSIESKILPTVELPEGLTAEERQQILQRGEEMWKEVLRMSGLSESEIETWINAQKEQIITARGEVFGELTRVPSEYLSQAQQDLGLGGKGGGAGSQFGFMDLRQYDMGTFQTQIMGRYAQIMREFQRNFSQFGWKPETDTTGFILKDGFTTMDVDLKLLQLALQDLVDINREKGLQGIYNLPEGATFMIPVTAFDLDRQTRAGMAGGGAGYGSAFPSGTGTRGPVAGRSSGVGPTDLEEGLGTESAARLLQRARLMRELRAAREAAGTDYVPGVRPLDRTAIRDKNVRPDEQEPPFVSPFTTPTTEWAPTYAEPFGAGIMDFFNQLYQAIPKTSFPIHGVPDTSGKPPDITTNLNLTSENVITLTVDGRVLATVIKPYLYSDLLRFSSSAPSTINKSVI